MSEFHNPVMLQECIQGLNLKNSGIYVDLTFGGGGHSQEILKHLSEGGKLYSFDQDEDVRPQAKTFRKCSFFSLLKLIFRFFSTLS